MEALEFIAIIVVAFVIVGWYVFNEAKGADGERGLLALTPDDDAQEKARKGGPRYRIKPRLARRAHDARSLDGLARAGAPAPAFRKTDDDASARRRFRRQDETRYRVKDRMADGRKRPISDD